MQQICASVPVPLKFSRVCPSGEQIHVQETVLRDHSKTSLHSHDFYEFLVVRRGTVVHHVNGIRQELPERALCLIQPADAHCFQRSSADERAVFTNVAVPSELFRHVLALVPVAPRRADGAPPLVLAETPQPVVDRIDLAATRLRAREASALTVQRLIATSLLVDVLAELVIAERWSRAVADNRAPPWLLRAARRMADTANYVEGLPRLLALCGKSQEHVTRTMKQVYGVTPTAFVNQLRLGEAARLLRDTDERVLTILLRTGFNNVSHFQTVFRRRFGCAPRAYRRRQRMAVDPVRLGEAGD